MSQHPSMGIQKKSPVGVSDILNRLRANNNLDIRYRINSLTFTIISKMPLANRYS